MTGTSLAAGAMGLTGLFRAGEEDGGDILEGELCWAEKEWEWEWEGGGGGCMGEEVLDAWICS